MLQGRLDQELRAARPALPAMRRLARHARARLVASASVLMIGFEHRDHARARPARLLFAFIVIGVFLIADPAFLAAEDDEQR